MKILRVDMTDLTATFEELPEAWNPIGGRGLSAKFLNREVDPAVDPLGKAAKLIFAGGPFAGTLAPSCGRISAGAKSPLTLGIKEANAGGPAAQKLDRLGIRAVIVQGRPKDDKLYLLRVNHKEICLEEADAYQGMRNYELVTALRREYGGKPAVISIGPVGERKLKAASIVMTDADGHPSRNAARGGLGAVMGAKGLKAVVIDDKGADPVPLADGDAFRKAVREWTRFFKEDPQRIRMSRIGTPVLVVPLRAMGSMPSRNYSSEETAGYENLGGDAIEAINKARKGRMAGCMPGCQVRCSVIYNDRRQKHLTSGFEYETIGLLGTNLGIADPDAVAAMDRLCDDLGIDTIELGSALGVAAGAGRLTMGDASSVFTALEAVESGTDFGILLADGVVSTCKALGIERIPAFKGQAIPAHDPRVCKAVGVTYLTSPMGADHTAGLSYEDSLSKAGQVDRSFNAQVMSALRDTMGYCLLATPKDTRRLLIFWQDLIKARYGADVSEAALMAIGRETLRDELDFNRGTEFHTAHEPYPGFTRNEPLAPAFTVFDVPDDEIEGIWRRL